MENKTLTLDELYKLKPGDKVNILKFDYIDREFKVIRSNLTVKGKFEDGVHIDDFALGFIYVSDDGTWVSENVNDKANIYAVQKVEQEVDEVKKFLKEQLEILNKIDIDEMQRAFNSAFPADLISGAKKYIEDQLQKDGHSISVKKLHVNVKYAVHLGDVKMPSNVYNQLKKAQENGDELTISEMKYPEAEEWLDAFIQERDSMETFYEIDEIEK